jgi:L-arabinokinase
MILPRLTIAFYVSAHGLGHASRAIELMRAILAAQPDAELHVRSAAAPWLFQATAPPGIDVQSVEVDTGMTQIDSLRIDEDASARAAAVFYGAFHRRVEAEARVLKAMKAGMVVGDIPPLAFAAAARAGVPSMAVANFTWDWIFSIYDAFDRLAPGVIATIRDAYATTPLALRLPLHGGFESMPVVRDIPFIARRSTRDPADTRRALGADAKRPLVLVSFGGYGADLPLEGLRRSDRFTIVSPERDAPAGLRYEDLVAAADVVVSKPGYGIVSECVANNTALLYTSRGRFVEYDLFVSEMPTVLRCRYIAQEDLFAGRWADAIDALLAQPPAPQQPRVDGATVAARIILNLLGRRRGSQ